MPATLRSMFTTDYPAVRALWEATPGVGLDESDELAPWTQYLRRNEGLSLIAIDEQGEVVGAVMCGHDGRRGYLSHLAVAEHAQRQGVGRLIVQECLNQLAGLGVLRCNVRVFAHNHGGTEFWRRLGFHPREDLAILQRPTALAPADAHLAS
ncbi:MAG: GNAT family N-acetyltransferase [Planctomycetales bacterium]|nr:GNAT family N-acetyltransferase [Planctomycetales bacterium]